jgi:quinol monooxygenase YgiN
MILVIGHFRVPVENLAAIRPPMRQIIAETVREHGCIEYAYAEDLAEPGLIRVSEKWRDRACLAAHFAAPHMAQWQRERAELGLYDRSIRIWDVGEDESV